MPNDGIKLLQIIKKAAVDAVQSGVTADFVKGLVTSTDPLIIQLENKLPIPADNIVLTKNTCCWSVDMDVDHQTENAAGGSGDAEYESHHHGYHGTKTYRVHNELAVGDIVILARCEGGQKFIAIDRVYNPDRGCGD
jgi:hypothetical protein